MKFSKITLTAGVLLALGLLVSTPAASRADIRIDFISSLETAPGVFTYTYDAVLLPQFKLNAAGSVGNEGTGNIFTLYDIQGLISDSETISPLLAGNGFTTYSEQLIGLTPTTQAPDDEDILNITFKYTLPGETSNASPFEVSLGTFTFDSIFPASDDDSIFYSAATQRISNSNIANNTAKTIGPSGNIVPEPASILTLGAGVVCLAGGLLRRRKKA